MNFHYVGMFCNTHSWVHVARNLCEGLSALGNSVTAQPTDVPANPNCKSPFIKQPPASVDAIFSYTIPPNFTRRFRLPAKCKAGIYNYEATVLVPAWANLLNRLDLVLPASEYCKQIFINNGVEPKKLRVLPYGIDRAQFNPDIPPAQLANTKKFKFLTVSIAHARKRFDVLLQAFAKAFTADDDVCLIIKTFRPEKAKKSFHVDIGALIQKYIGAKGPTVVVYDGECETGPLYTLADAVVQCSSAEGFGIPALEALACQRPLIVTDYGGFKDFCSNDNSYLISCVEKPAPYEMQYWHYSPSSMIGEPSVDHLAELMKQVYTNYEQAKAKAVYGYHNTVPNYEWIKIAQRMVDYVTEFVGVRATVQGNTLSSRPHYFN